MTAYTDNRYARVTVIALAVLTLIAGCGRATPAPTSIPATVATTATSVPPTSTVITSSTLEPTEAPTATPESEGRADGLSEEEAATLSSLEQVDDHPLYTMRYYGAYRRTSASSVEPSASYADEGVVKRAASPTWACSLFAALGDTDGMHYGRNFDWQYSPALLLFTAPPDGYASVSMVDIAYLGFEEDEVRTLTDLPLAERRALLDVPFWPFDGMNEHGLVVGMAAVPGSAMPHDPDRETLDSLAVIREMLDHARDVDEALAIMQSYNIDWGGGPALHYLLADSAGRSVLVEFYQGEMALIPSERPWHQATNFLRTSAGESDEGQCWRYDTIAQRLSETEGRMTAQDAATLLADVAQGGIENGTQWSIVYGITTGEINVAMGRKYDSPHNYRSSHSAATRGNNVIEP